MVSSKSKKSGPDKKSAEGKDAANDKKPAPEKMPQDVYQAELHRLQTELVEMQEWVRTTGARIVVIFEGRDAAGKGGAIKRITEYLNPRIAQIVALPAPTDRERTEWYFQRYIAHLPAAGEIRLFDRSWYNRGGVEKVMGYCTPLEHQRFLRQCPIFERLLIEDGIMLRKYWFSVSDKQQEKRFESRLTDPMRRWKLSPTDVESVTRWEDYSRAKDEMFVHTDVPGSRWFVVDAENKKRARLNMIAHLLSTIPYEHVARAPLELPKRPKSTGYERPDKSLQLEVPDLAARLLDKKGGHAYEDPEDAD
ncbi:polyphosphate kinase 2 [Propionibacterium sp.]|uniref:polyphosphate kinase 2 n=1 Tax=Propionibacterium sp. TaxID=1977903 RepID=UPI0039EC7179